jgi:hypothetical protein
MIGKKQAPQSGLSYGRKRQWMPIEQAVYTPHGIAGQIEIGI